MQGTIQARTHLRLTLARQRSMIFAQRKLRLTMQHVHGHSGNLGNNVETMQLHLGLSALLLTTTLPPATVATHSIKSTVSFFKIKVSFMFTFDLIVFFVHFLCTFV